MRLLVPMLGVVLLLAACKPAADAGSRASAPAAPEAQTSDTSSPKAASSGPAPTPAPPQLAMAYNYSLALPSAQVRPMMESHQDACERAGTLQCQVLAATAKSDGHDRDEASLTLRATPAWMRMFRTRAEADVKSAGGHLGEAATTGEDLSAPIVDTQAAQQARAAEIARLKDLMARRTRHLQDTLDVEKEITRVQGEMDQASSEMTAMQGRVAMQTVTVDYQSLAAAPPDGVGAPVVQAGHAFVGNMMSVFAVIMYLASYTLPFVLVAAPMIWFFSRRAKRPQAPTTPTV